MTNSSKSRLTFKKSKTKNRNNNVIIKLLELHELISFQF